MARVSTPPGASLCTQRRPPAASPPSVAAAAATAGVKADRLAHLSLRAGAQCQPSAQGRPLPQPLCAQRRRRRPAQETSAPSPAAARSQLISALPQLSARLATRRRTRRVAMAPSAPAPVAAGGADLSATNVCIVQVPGFFPSGRAARPAAAAVHVWYTHTVSIYIPGREQSTEEAKTARCSDPLIGCGRKGREGKGFVACSD